MSEWRTDGWVDGRLMGEWVDDEMDGWTDRGQVSIWVDAEQMDGWICSSWIIMFSPVAPQGGQKILLLDLAVSPWSFSDLGSSSQNLLPSRCLSIQTDNAAGGTGRMLLKQFTHTLPLTTAFSSLIKLELVLLYWYERKKSDSKWELTEGKERLSEGSKLQRWCALYRYAGRSVERGMLTLPQTWA